MRVLILKRYDVVLTMIKCSVETVLCGCDVLFQIYYVVRESHCYGCMHVRTCDSLCVYVYVYVIAVCFLYDAAS